MGTAAASAGAAGPSEGPQAGRSSGRTEAGVHCGERTTRLRERADYRDSEPDYLLRPTMHGPGGTLLIIAHCFLERRSPNIGWRPKLIRKGSQQRHLSYKCRYFESVIKGPRALAQDSAIPPFRCGVYSHSLAGEQESYRASVGSAGVATGASYSRGFSRPNRL